MKVSIVDMNHNYFEGVELPVTVEGHALSMYDGVVWVTGAELIAIGCPDADKTEDSEGFYTHFLYAFQLGTQVEASPEVLEAFHLEVNTSASFDA